MKYLFVLLMLLSIERSNAQDSLSTVFIKLYNEYRTQNNLPTLVYDMELDSLAMIRLIESSAGVNDCFSDPIVGMKCENGYKNLHFKFQSNASDFNNKNSKIMVLSENMNVCPGFTIYKKVNNKKDVSFMKNVNDSDYIITKNDSIPLEVVQGFLRSWIESHDHNLNLLDKKATRFAFKIFSTTHNNYQWLHACFLIGQDKK